MKEEKDNLIVQKAYSFALEVVKLYKTLTEQKEFVLSKQLLRSGTSIGANVHEAVASVSKRDFVNKLGIALKETREASYWLNLLKDGGFITDKVYEVIILECHSIIKILNSIILTTKERYLSNTNNS